MSKCPYCHGEIPFKKFFWLNNFSVIKCPHCQSQLLPNKKTLSIIGGISGGVMALTVGVSMLIYHLLNGYGFEIFLFTAVSVVLLYAATVQITRNLTSFTLKN